MSPVCVKKQTDVFLLNTRQSTIVFNLCEFAYNYNEYKKKEYHYIIETYFTSSCMLNDHIKHKKL